MLLRGVKEGVSRHVWERGEGGPGLLDPTVITLSLLPLHAILDPSLRQESVPLDVCSVLMQLRQAVRMSFALAFRVTLPSSQLKWRFSAKRWILRMARNPVVRLQLWTRPSSRIWSRSSNLERRRTLFSSKDDSAGCATPFGFSKNLCCSQNLQFLNTAVASTTELSQTVAQVAEAVREVKAGASQRVRVRDHRLEVEPPDSDQQELWRAN